MRLERSRRGALDTESAPTTPFAEMRGVAARAATRSSEA